MNMKRKFGRIAAFAPVFALMAAAYIFPVIDNIIKSFYNDAGEFVGLKNYSDVLHSYYFLDSLGFTLKIAVISTAAALCLAIVAAFALRETFAGKKLVLFMFQYNLGIPHIVVAMMMVMLLSNTGIVSSAVYSAGLTDGADSFPWLVRDSKGLGIMIAFVWKYFPYIGLSALGVLQGASREYEQQAAVLGVGKMKRIIHVIMPQVLPALSVSAIIVFAAAFGEYEIPAILGATSHRTLSVMIYIKYCDLSTRNMPQAYAMMVMMSVVLMLLIIAAYALSYRRRDVQ